MLLSPFLSFVLKLFLISDLAAAIVIGSLNGISIPSQSATSNPTPVTLTLSIPSATPAAAVDPFSQSEALFSPETAPDCRGRCLGGVTDFLKHGLGFASIVFKFGEGLVEGAVDSVVGAVEGVWSIVSDPKDFVVNIVHAGENPKETALAIAKAVSSYCANDGNTTAESIGKCLGNAAGQVGMLFIGVGEAKEASIVAKSAEIAGQDSKFAELLKGVSVCSISRRILFKRAPCAPSSSVAKAGKAIADSSSPVAKSGSEIAKLAARSFTVEQASDQILTKIANLGAGLVDKSAELTALLKPTLDLLTSGALSGLEKDLAMFVVRNQLQATEELAKGATGFEKAFNIPAKLEKDIFFTQPDFTKTFGVDREGTGFPFAGKSVLDSAIESNQVVPELFVTKNAEGAEVIASNNNRGLAALMNGKLPITTCRFIREADATNFIKNGKKVFSKIKEVLEKGSNGAVDFGRTVTVGPNTRLVALGKESTVPLSVFEESSDLL